MVDIDQNPPLRAEIGGYAPYRVSVNEYTAFREHGFVVVRGLISLVDVQELNDHMDDVLSGRESFPGVPPALSHLSANEIASYWERVHMLHRVSPLHERYLLHPRILDVLEAINGPGCPRAPDNAVLQTARTTRSRLSSGFLLHPDPPGHIVRGMAWRLSQRLRRTGACGWSEGLSVSLSTRT